jgi:hypothetical protein
VQVAALNPEKSESADFGQAHEYLARIVPWPQPGEGPAFVDIVWSFKSDKYDKPGWTGRAVTTVGDAVNAISWALKSDTTLGVYVCQSTQREAQEVVTPKGYKYFKPVRLQENAAALKSLWLDIDVKAPIPGKEVKGYPTIKCISWNSI